MKKILFLTICGLISFSALAQKVKLKSKECVYEAINLPAEVLEGVKTYSTSIANNSKDLWNLGMTKTDLERDFLRLYGFQRVAKDGDIQLELTVGNFKITSEKLEESLKSLKGGTGPDNKQYHYDFVYTFPFDLRVMKNGEKIYSTDASSAKSLMGNKFSSQKFDTVEQARKNKAKYRTTWIKTEKKKLIEESGNIMLQAVNNKFGYKPEKVTLKFDAPNTKKDKTHQGFEEQVMKTIKTISSIKADIPISADVKGMVQTTIDAWKEDAKIYSVDDKKQAKLKVAYLMNVMNAAFAIEDFETSEDFANQLLSMKKEKALAKRTIKRIKNLKEGLAKTGLASTHHTFNVGEDFVPSSDGVAASDNASTAASTAASNEELMTVKGDEVRNKALGLHEDAREFSGEIEYTNGKKFNGVFVVDYSSYKDVMFFRGGNLNLFKEDGDAISKQRFDIKKIKSFKVGDRVFMIHKLTGALAIGNANPYTVIEAVERTDKMELYVSHPMSKADLGVTSLTGNFIMRKPGDKFQDLNGVKYLNFKKGFSKYIKDCPEMAKKVKSGEYKRNLEDLIALVDDYTNTCK